MSELHIALIAEGPTDYETVFCIPSKSTNTWLAAACFLSTLPILRGGECDLNLEARLSRLTIEERIKKTTAKYREKAPIVTRNWNDVKSTCSLAERFESTLQAHISA